MDVVGTAVAAAGVLVIVLETDVVSLVEISDDGGSIVVTSEESIAVLEGETITSEDRLFILAAAEESSKDCVWSSTGIAESAKGKVSGVHWEGERGLVAVSGFEAIAGVVQPDTMLEDVMA